MLTFDSRNFFFFDAMRRDLLFSEDALVKMNHISTKQNVHRLSLGVYGFLNNFPLGGEFDVSSFSKSVLTIE